MGRSYVKKIKIPKFNEKLAEFIGVLLGDGNIHTYRKGKKVATYMIQIAGNSKKDKVYLENYVFDLFKDLFGFEPKFYQNKNSNCIYLIAHSLELVNFLEKMGLKSGKKIMNRLTIPKWIFQDKSFIRSCLRGLYDTDGCLYELKPHWPGLFQLNFENRNITLLRDLKRALDILGIKSSKIHGKRTKEGHRVDITSKSMIHKFYKEIGTSNPRLQLKFKEFFQSPVV